LRNSSTRRAFEEGDRHPFLLDVVAAGLIGFALYSITDARYAKI
jgi:hypothetical protein